MGNLIDNPDIRAAALASLAAEEAKRRKKRSLVPASFAAGERWFVVYTDPSCEFVAQRELEEQAFTVFMPFEQRFDRHGARRGAPTKRVRKTALFPRYLFTSIDLNQRPECVSEINETYGVVEILRRDEIPIAIPEAFVLDMRRRHEAGCFDYTLPTPEFSPGEIVRVTEGPFASFNAEIVKMRPHDRVAALLSLFGRESEVELPIDWLEKL